METKEKILDIERDGLRCVFLSKTVPALKRNAIT